MQPAKITFLVLSLFAESFAFAQTQTPSAPKFGVAKKLDANSLGTGGGQPTPTPTPLSTPAQNSGRSKSIAADDGALDTKGEKDVLSTLHSLDTLISQTPPGPLRDPLILNRAIAENRYGRHKVITQKQYSLTGEIQKYLSASIADADSLINNPKTNRDIVIRAHDVAATSALYLEKNDLAKQHFLAELAMNPPGEKAGRIGLIMAEQYFDQGDFQSAFNYYNQYFSKMIPKWKELSLYKLGWCMINLKQQDKAMDYFLKVAHVKSATGIGRDAIRDLAYFTSGKAGSTPEVLATEQKLTTQDDRLTYLSDVLANLEALNFPTEHAAIANRLLQIEKRPEERVGILLSQVRMQKRVFATVPYYKAYAATMEYVRKLGSRDLKTAMGKHGTALELETENIFKAYIDTYSGKVKTLDGSTPPSKPDLIAVLKYVLQFFKSYFKSSAHFPTVVELWENLCIDNNDWAAVDDITQFIINDQPHLSALLESAYLNQIGALDQLKTDPKRREVRVREYVGKFPGTARWPEVAKWYALNEMKAGHFDVALKVWTTLMKLSPSEENFYQLQYCRFKLNDYDGVLDDALNKTYLKPQTELMDLYREASLKAAEAAKQAKNAEKYRKHIDEFIRLSTDPAKARIARLDFLNYLLANGQLDDAEKRFNSQGQDEDKAKEYDPFRNDLWKAAVEKENYELAVRMAPIQQQKVFSNLLAKHAISPKDLDALKEHDRNYFLGLFVLFDPDFAMKYVKPKTDKDLWLLAYRIKNNQWQFQRTPELEKLLGKKYEFAEMQYDTLPVEKQIDDVKFPDLSKLSAAKQAHAVEDNLYLVRKNSKSLMKQIVGKSTITQLHILEKMQGLEAQMADFLLSSPVPTGLTPEQTQQYKDGLKGAADEFTNQANQYKMLADKAREAIDKGKKEFDDRLLAQPNAADWDYPSGFKGNSKLQSAVKLVNGGNVLGGLALLDYLRQAELPKDEDFFDARTGLILSAKPNDALRIYLRDELEKSKQTKIVDQWAKMVKKPDQPEAK